MKHPNELSPQATKNLELEWHEYLLRADHSMPRQIETCKSYNVYYVLGSVVICTLLAYIGSFFI